MSKPLSWIVLIIALLLGTAAGMLAAKVSPNLFWALWIPALAAVAVVIAKSKDDAKSEAPAPAEIQEP